MTIRVDHGTVVDLDTKAYSETEDCHVITGYGSVFNNTDLGNDAVVPGAFAKSLREHGLPLLLFNHKMEDAPIGTITEAKEDKRGLWFKAELPKDDSFVSGRIIPQLKRRGLKGTSIGYKATQKETRKADGVRLLKEIRLYEISVVNMPMNPLAGVETIKGLVAFQDLYIDRNVSTWDAAAAFDRLKAKFDGSVNEMKSAFLYADEELPVDEWDKRLLIADVDEQGRLAANPLSIYKACACVAGARGGVALPDEAETAVKDHLERYYSRLNLDSAFKSLSADEFKYLDRAELEARLRGLGISRKLATDIIDLRDADRSTKARREQGPSEDAKSLLTAFTSLMEAAAAIHKQTAG